MKIKINSPEILKLKSVIRLIIFIIIKIVMNKDIENKGLNEELNVKFFRYRNNCIKTYYFFTFYN